MKNEPKAPVVQPPANPPIVQPMIDELTGKNPKPEPTSPAEKPPQPAELDQDAGGGFNPDHTYPQA